MVIKAGNLECDIYKSAFSGEIVFAVQTERELYEGVAPRQYLEKVNGELSADRPQKGSLRVRVISNGGNRAKIATPDGLVIDVPASIISY